MIEKVKELGLPKETEDRLIVFLTNNTNWTKQQNVEFIEILNLLVKR